MKNFLIIGGGLAGVTLAHQLEERGQSFTLVDNRPQYSSSKVAAGFWNPVVYKRLTESYRASVLLPYLNEFYGKIERKLATKIVHNTKQLRLFATEQERHRFIDKALASEISQFLNHEVMEEYSGVVSLFGIGIVEATGRLDTINYIDKSITHFDQNSSFLESDFSYNDLSINDDSVEYKGQRYENVAFCEGYKAVGNPYFPELKLKPTKGEALILSIPELSQEYSISRSVSLIPLGNDKFWLGSNYSWDDTTEKPTDKAKAELLEKLDKFLTFEYQLTDHQAGIRPAAHDRQPKVMQSSIKKRAYLLNGFGTKGVMYAPYYSEKLVAQVVE